MSNKKNKVVTITHKIRIIIYIAIGIVIIFIAGILFFFYSLTQVIDKEAKNAGKNYSNQRQEQQLSEKNNLEKKYQKIILPSDLKLVSEEFIADNNYPSTDSIKYKYSFTQDENILSAELIKMIQAQGLQTYVETHRIGTTGRINDLYLDFTFEPHNLLIVEIR